MRSRADIGHGGDRDLGACVVAQMDEVCGPPAGVGCSRDSVEIEIGSPGGLASSIPNRNKR